MNDGTRSFKPNRAQIGMITDAFAAQNISFHADTGEYGGGNELPSYQSPLSFFSSPDLFDFSDYKTGDNTHVANYNPKRQGIWRYIISGYNYLSDQSSSGISEVGGSNIFISYGLIKDTFTYSDFDTAIAGTMMHEIGHSLCLSDTAKYTNQPSECIYGGVDSNSPAYLLYNSSMSYLYQESMVNYSDDSNGPADHDDWNAVKLGISHFSGLQASSGAPVKMPRSRTSLSVNSAVAEPNIMTTELSKKAYEFLRNHPHLNPNHPNVQQAVNQ